MRQGAWTAETVHAQITCTATAPTGHALSVCDAADETGRGADSFSCNYAPARKNARQRGVQALRQAHIGVVSFKPLMRHVVLRKKVEERHLEQNSRWHMGSRR